MNKSDPTGTSEQCGYAWFEWTYRWIEGPHAGEISRTEYHQQWVCDQVPDAPAAGGGKGGAGTQTVGRDQRPPCTLELVLLLANGASDLSTIVGVGLGATLLAQGGAHVLFGGALESGLTLNGGINGMRTAGGRYMSGQWLGRFSREGAEVAIAQGQAELLRGSLATGVGAAAQAAPGSSPAMIDDGGHFDWKLFIPGVGTYRAWKTYGSCRNGN